MSFVVVYFLSSVIYYFNAFEGEIFVGKLNRTDISSYPVESGFYIVLLINMVIVVFALLLEKEKGIYRTKTRFPSEKTVMKFFFAAVFVLSMVLCVKMNVFSRTQYNKSELADAGGQIATYYKYLASYAFVYMWSREDIDFPLRWKIIASIPIFTTFLFGNRSYLVIALVAVMFNRMYTYCFRENMKLSKYLRKNKKIFLIFGGLLVVTLVAKGITSALFTGNFELVFQRLSSLSYYKQVFFVSEPNTISRNLNLIILNDYQIRPSSYIALWAYLIPLLTGKIEQLMGVESFAKVYQREVYVDGYNNASTYLGEAFANGGYLTVAIVAALYLLLLTLLFRGYRRCRSNIAKTSFLIMATDGAFYIQRNCMAFEFSRLRDYVYIAVLLYCAIGLLNRKHHIKI